ncbi:glycerophosphodiester phosphodiesterase [Rathayibacter sp. VKM Ac-2803]|uniref:glycerophosphodiester phosphodiesterase family protein n=1 Tax=Rathayibacter sp. VKM Ac-2803 TaxID=2609256 RepID=UPI00135A9764|nr:glycerophosphodiester phosphodiesterase family protein [Rathayibacter sp. VKM Ac-2803]MWV49903.1 glycerophosphodiester phosphodiesterase [Rathayibacter sp. VKM Ac-2803]
MSDRDRVPFLEGPRPRVLAHRGFGSRGPGNTIGAFQRALDAGADLLETDVRASLDGVAFLQHDDEVVDETGHRHRVDRLRAEELERLVLDGGEHPVSLAEALHRFPEARFNIDVKAREAVDATIAAVRGAHAESRVLITSFSESRRRRTLRGLPGAATSASAPLFLLALVAAHANATAVVRVALRGVDALQVPESALGLRVTTPRILARLRSSGCEIHLWTVNDRQRMTELLELGVDGLVTDRTDLARAAVDAFLRGAGPQR